MMPELGPLHFLRPHWLWALLALAPLAWAWRARRRSGGVWQRVVDPHLLPHLLERGGDRRARAAGALAAFAWVLAVLALAGPSWRQDTQPLWQGGTPLVVALDLSSASNAADLPPSRLAQARAKIAALLRARAAGQVGLVAYAGDAFTVAPLTDDAGNVALFLDALAPEVMPVDGQRADRAIAQARRLLRQAGFERGAILLLTDHADAAARGAAASAARAGYRVFALGLGRAEGAAYRRGDGTLARTRLDAASLRALAAAGGGRYAAIAGDDGDGDLRALGVLTPGAGEAMPGGERGGRSWRDEGYWLLPPLLLLALFAFRRGGAVAALLLCLWLPWQPARAVELWRRPDQAAHARMAEAAQAYRRGDYARAAALYAGVGTADAHYNRGNALAKAGRYPQALAAYDEALKRAPRMADALANKRAVEAAMKPRPPPRGADDSQRPGSQGGGDGASAGAPQPQAAQDRPSQRQAQRSPADRAEPGAAPGKAPAPRPADARRQAAADAAQRERMQRALQRAGRGAPRDGAREPAEAETPGQRERRLANEAWLRRVPDDPGGLLREKFRIEYERRRNGGTEE
ncbi:Ca-activated chloride channel family protein [Vulcaniibacterium tengchongense]|uniref:Ca-activated chloride channel family protein n=2 Tax=Vulcaniibacterium tengchongense TaxID=1273429 RepID=A0A3N4UXU0_9GAMM|nr:VWA domain-containing protein [Vulcaniibacterium tengchongense]RPE74813.1 Ca-activated chloride channel family protein [Vulcaniibacterium tengchongense]